MAGHMEDPWKVRVLEAKQHVRRAQALDVEGNDREAFCTYLGGIACLAQLLENATRVKDSEERLTHGEEQLLQVLESCVERVKTLATQPGFSTTHDTACRPTASANQYSGDHVDNEHVIAENYPPATPAEDNYVVEVPHDLLESLPTPDEFQELLQLQTACCARELGPMDKARLENRRLADVFKKRMSLLEPKYSGEKTSLSLGLHRKMMENERIAKAHEDAIKKKRAEQRLFFQQLADKKFAASEQEEKAFYTSVLEYQQENSWLNNWCCGLQYDTDDADPASSLVAVVFSCPDHPASKELAWRQCNVYSDIYKHITAVQWGFLNQNRLKTPGKTSSKDLFSELLDCTETETEGEGGLQMEASLPASYSQNEVEHVDNSRIMTKPHLRSSVAQVDNGKIGQEAEQDVQGNKLFQTEKEMSIPLLLDETASIARTIQSHLARMEHLLTVVFEHLSTVNAWKEILQEIFYQPLWNHLLRLFRFATLEQESALSLRLTWYANALPADLGMPYQLQLVHGMAMSSSSSCPSFSMTHDVSNNTKHGGVATDHVDNMHNHQEGKRVQEVVSNDRLPYKAAIDELRRLLLLYSPQRKLECIVRVMRQISTCVEEFQREQAVPSNGDFEKIGADDLLPILTFVVLRSQLVQLPAECAALGELISESDLLGEKGYCLTSLQTAITFISTLAPPVGTSASVK
uniref:VPS9 domain-containing protein 1 isoform X2 n=1 Tax=Myxine glutinosa TaxID=7769 RepID=UPI00358E388D